MTIGEKIKKLRTEKMMTQAELSGDRVTRNMLSLIEKGRAVPSLQTLEYVASRLNVSTAFLLADEKEEQHLMKAARISDIKLAYKDKNYDICLDFCRRIIGDSHNSDDEIKLIMAEASLQLAKRELRKDRVRSCVAFLDDAVLYASETQYNTKHISAVAGVLFDYLGRLSPSLVSENLDMDSFDIEDAKSFCADDIFCRYIASLDDVQKGKYKDRNLEHEALERHIECKKLMHEGDYEKANNILEYILKIDERLSGILLYNIFYDLEECCRRLGNPKNARGYADEKVIQLERILSS